MVQLIRVALTRVHPLLECNWLTTPPVHCSGSTVLAGRGPAAPKGGEFVALRVDHTGSRWRFRLNAAPRFGTGAYFECESSTGASQGPLGDSVTAGGNS